jgi:proteasome lid subunit RPN8/RPN11
MLVLPNDLRGTILKAAVRAYPNECCGLLLGIYDGDVIAVDEVMESENLSAAPRNSFEIDMRLRLRLQKALRGTGRDIVGHYHSHPDGPAEPSARDLEQAWEPDLVWVIVGVTGNEVDDIRAFRLDRGSSVPLEIAELAG